MNLKSIVAIGAMSLSLAGLAYGQGQAGVNYVYITGSTAFRNSVFAAIDSTAVFDNSSITFKGYGSTTAAKCSYMIFSNSIATHPYIIKCEWSGSEAGVIDCASNVSETFPADSLLGAAGSSSAVSSPSTPPSVDSHANDIGFADNNQAYSRTPKPTLAGTEVGVIPFTWVKNAQKPADKTASWLTWSNVTLAQINVAIQNNGTPLSLFTANPADTNFVYVAGHNNNSGTRANALLASGIGTGTFLSQIYITGGAADGSATITLENQSALVPPLNSAGATYLGTDGQDSGGTLATSMTYEGSASQLDINNPWAGPLGTTADYGWYAIAYLGRSDANTAITGNAVEMTFNGVAETPANIENGSFSFWGNEWMYKNPSISSAGTTVFGKLSTGIDGKLDGTTGISYGSMNVYKSSSASYPVNSNF